MHVAILASRSGRIVVGTIGTERGHPAGTGSAPPEARRCFSRFPANSLPTRFGSLPGVKNFPAGPLREKARNLLARLEYLRCVWSISSPDSNFSLCFPVEQGNEWASSLLRAARLAAEDGAGGEAGAAGVVVKEEPAQRARPASRLPEVARALKDAISVRPGSPPLSPRGRSFRQENRWFSCRVRLLRCGRAAAAAAPRSTDRAGAESCPPA